MSGRSKIAVVCLGLFVSAMIIWQGFGIAVNIDVFVRWRIVRLGQWIDLNLLGELCRLGDVFQAGVWNDRAQDGKSEVGTLLANQRLVQ